MRRLRSPGATKRRNQRRARAHAVKRDALDRAWLAVRRADFRAAHAAALSLFTQGYVQDFSGPRAVLRPLTGDDSAEVTFEAIRLLERTIVTACSVVSDSSSPLTHEDRAVLERGGIALHTERTEP